MAVTEGPLERAAVREARKHGVWALKSEPMYAGFPDRMLFAPERRIELVEFKSATGDLSKAQLTAHEILSRLGWNVHVIRDLEEFKKLLR